jgi:hypothetical protein
MFTMKNSSLFSIMLRLGTFFGVMGELYCSISNWYVVNRAQLCDLSVDWLSTLPKSYLIINLSLFSIRFENKVNFIMVWSYLLFFEIGTSPTSAYMILLTPVNEKLRSHFFVYAYRWSQACPHWLRFLYIFSSCGPKVLTPKRS